MKKIIITMAIAMLTATTVNAESWRHKDNHRGNDRDNVTIIVNNDRGGFKVNNDRGGYKVNNDRGGFDRKPDHKRPMVGHRVHTLPREAVKVHRHGRDYYRVGNVLYDKIATATGIVYGIVELLND